MAVPGARVVVVAAVAGCSSGAADPLAAGAMARAFAPALAVFGAVGAAALGPDRGSGFYGVGGFLLFFILRRTSCGTPQCRQLSCLATFGQRPALQGLSYPPLPMIKEFEARSFSFQLVLLLQVHNLRSWFGWHRCVLYDTSLSPFVFVCLTLRSYFMLSFLSIMSCRVVFGKVYWWCLNSVRLSCAIPKTPTN